LDHGVILAYNAFLSISDHLTKHYITSGVTKDYVDKVTDIVNETLLRQCSCSVGLTSISLLTLYHCAISHSTTQ